MPVETCRRRDSIWYCNYYDYTNMDIIKHVCAVKEANISFKDLIRCCLNRDIQCSGTDNNVVRYDY
jgi:hypothetical protein